MSLSAQNDNKKKDILILGKAQTQGLGEHSLTGEKMYSINFSISKRRFCLSLHYGANSYLFVNGVEMIKFKAKNSEIVATSLCLGNISKVLSISNMKKKTGLYGTVYDFIVDYDAISVENMLKIHKYLIKKHNIV